MIQALEMNNFVLYACIGNTVRMQGKGQPTRKEHIITRLALENTVPGFYSMQIAAKSCGGLVQDIV